MKISTSWSTNQDTGQAVEGAFTGLLVQPARKPSLLLVYASVRYDAAVLLAALAEHAPGVPVAGGTSCLGVMTSEGFHAADGMGLGLFAIDDPAGDYGVGSAALGDEPRRAGSLAIQRAIEAAGRPGEPPGLVWLSSAPGFEEEVLLGIQDFVGPGVPIAGGSTADNTVAGQWLQFEGQQVLRDAVVIAAMYPSTAVHLAFHSGYSTTAHAGRVSRAAGRTLMEIDGQPAAEVYNRWTNGVIEDHLAGGNVLAATTLYPLGRRVGQYGDIPYHRLSHPEIVTPEKALRLFATIEEGDEIILMAGTRSGLVTRAGRVATSALNNGAITSGQISGALVVYCAGCMLTVQDQMDGVAHAVRQALGGKPFLGMFTFGEQGCFFGGENHHGNLMISVVVFEKEAS